MLRYISSNISRPSLCSFLYLCFIIRVDVLLLALHPFPFPLRLSLHLNAKDISLPLRFSFKTNHRSRPFRSWNNDEVRGDKFNSPFISFCGHAVWLTYRTKFCSSSLDHLCFSYFTRRFSACLDFNFAPRELSLSIRAHKTSIAFFSTVIMFIFSPYRGGFLMRLDIKCVGKRARERG